MNRPMSFNDLFSIYWRPFSLCKYVVYIFFLKAFTLIDQNRDGFIDKEDLHDMLASMGKAIEYMY